MFLPVPALLALVLGEAPKLHQQVPIKLKRCLSDYTQQAMKI